VLKIVVVLLLLSLISCVYPLRATNTVVCQPLSFKNSLLSYPLPLILYPFALIVLFTPTHGALHEARSGLFVAIILFKTVHY
jgi:hypothetical protein